MTNHLTMPPYQWHIYHFKLYFINTPHWTHWHFIQHYFNCLLPAQQKNQINNWYILFFFPLTCSVLVCNALLFKLQKKKHNLWNILIEYFLKILCSLLQMLFVVANNIFIYNTINNNLTLLFLPHELWVT